MPHRRITEVLANRPFPTVTQTTTVRDAAIIMKAWHSSAVLVIDQAQLLGILTERDVVFRVVSSELNPATTPVADVMTCQVTTIAADKPFGHALHLMYEGGFRHLPVVDAEGHPVGLLAAHDALDQDGLQIAEDLERREEITVIL